MLKYKTKAGVKIYERQCRRCDKLFLTREKKAKICHKCRLGKRDFMQEFKLGIWKEIDELQKELKK